jgi:hypothetical protein
MKNVTGMLALAVLVLAVSATPGRTANPCRKGTICAQAILKGYKTCLTAARTKWRGIRAVCRNAAKTKNPALCQQAIQAGYPTSVADAATATPCPAPPASCPDGQYCNVEPGGNVCLPSLCSSDADCGAGFACNGACYKICGAANPCAADCDTGDPCNRKACLSGLTSSGANICSIEPIGDPSGTLGCPITGHTDDCNACPACLGGTTTTTLPSCGAAVIPSLFEVENQR